MLKVKRLLVVNNFCFAPKVSKNFDETYFAPLYYTDKQKDFLDKRYEELKKLIPKLKWVHEFEMQECDAVLAWDAFGEKQAFGDNLLKKQNRLFSKLDFSFSESFTNFRKKAEPLLPAYYEMATTPYDSEVLKELSYYFDEKKLASTYFETRNGLVGRDFSTKFSRFLACGVLDVRYLYNKVKDFEKEYGTNKSSYWIIFELLWREFFYWHYQKHDERYFSEGGLRGKLDFSEFRPYEFSELRKMSDIPLFLCALNELEQTGFLSNRIRQIFASIWLNDLKLNWRSGADLFERYLIDYDVYSNYGNWMYLAGVGVDPRGKRYFNVEKQLQTYDPEDSYIKRWLS